MKVQAILVMAGLILGTLSVKAGADTLLSTYSVTRCVSDNGCFVNPFTPNKQQWTYTYGVYRDSQGQEVTRLISKGESGGCC